MVRNPMRNAECGFEFIVGLTGLAANLYMAVMLFGAWFWIPPLVSEPWAAKAIIVMFGALNLFSLASSLDFLADTMRSGRK